jgi:hypothetical protein
VVKSPYIIPNGSFVRFENGETSSSFSISMCFNKNNVLTQTTVIRVNKSTGDVTITPVYFENGDRVYETLNLNGVQYSFPSESDDVPGDIPDDVPDDVPDDSDTEDTSEVNGVYLNRIELYLLWLLSVQSISCGVLLFLCFKGFEKV